MIGTRTRKILRDVWARKLRTLLVSSSIFIGVFGVVTLVSAGDLLVAQLEQDLQEDRLSMLSLGLTVNSATPVDNDAALAPLEDYPGVETVEGRAVYPLYWRLPGEDGFNDGNIAAHTEPFAESQLQPTRLLDGEYPVASEGEVRQIAVERRMADRFDSPTVIAGRRARWPLTNSSSPTMRMRATSPASPESARCCRASSTSAPPRMKRSVSSAP
jgi:hypothetical protein